MLGGRSLHKKSGFSLTSQDFDVEGAALDGDDYDAGLSLPLLGPGSQHGTAWSAKGPAAFKPAMSPLASVGEHLSWARAGFRDANRWLEAAKLITDSSEIRNGLLKGFLLTSTVVGGIYFLELTLVPTHIFFHNEVADLTANSLENVFVVYPLIAAAYWLASLWTADVAKAAYSHKHGRTFSAVVPTITAVTSQRLLQEAYRIILVINYLTICYVLQKIPILGRPMAFFFMSFIDGYYIFETIWAARGWSLERRMRYAECRWSYFVAFGLPSTLISFFHPSGLLNVMLFMLIFPFCTVLALLSSPQPRSPPPSEPWLARIPFFIITVKLHRALLRAFPAPAHRGPMQFGAVGGGLAGAIGSGASARLAASAVSAGVGGGGTGGGVYGAYPVASGASHFGGGGGGGYDGSSLGRRTAAQMVGGAWGASASSSPRLDNSSSTFAPRVSADGRGPGLSNGYGAGAAPPSSNGAGSAHVNGTTTSSGIASPHASAALQSPVRATSAAAAAAGSGAPPSAPPMGPARFGRTGAPSAGKAGKKD